MTHKCDAVQTESTVMSSSIYYLFNTSLAVEDLDGDSDTNARGNYLKRGNARLALVLM